MASTIKTVGWVILNQQHELYCGDRHPGTRKSGFPIWSAEGFCAFKKPAIFETAKEAVDVAGSIYRTHNIRCGAKALEVDTEGM